MKLVAAIRLALAPIVLWDLPTLVYAAMLLSKGGTQAVHSWVVHVALMGRLFDTGVAEQQIVHAYVVFALMIFVAPVMLYWLQRWLASRLDAKQAR